MSVARPFLLGLLSVFSLAAAEIDQPRGTAPASTWTGFRPLVPDDRAGNPLLAPSSNEGEARIHQFKTLPGVKIQLWADEPMLANPVSFSVDEKGRVFTAETYRYRTSVLDIRHYMFMLEDDLASRNITNRLEVIRKWFGPEGEKELSRETEVVRMIEDTDHDGQADKSTVIVDGLNSPLDGIASGVLARHGELWLTDIPSLWRFSSGGGGGEAARARKPSHGGLASSPRVSNGFHAQELLRGFGVRFSFTGHDLHGLKFGPDGRLYFSCGDRGTHVVNREGRVIDLPDEGAVFRCEPDGSFMEVVHRGLRNPQELAFDESGNLFTGDNDSDQGDRERWVQIIDGADSGWRVAYQHAPLGNAGMWNMERLWVPYFDGQAAYLLPPIANIGDGPSGLVYDYGTGLDRRLRQRFLLAYFKGTSAKSGICSLATEPHGAGFSLVAHDEFVWNVLAPDVDIGPDGAVWFSDWHEGWPKSNKGRIYRATFATESSDVKDTLRILEAGVAGLGDEALMGLFTNPDMRVRQEAQFELANRLRGRRDPKERNRAVDELERKLGRLAQNAPSTVARLHAVWCLGMAGRMGEWRPPLLSLLQLEHGEVAVQAARAIGWWAGHQRTLSGRAGPGESAPKYDRFLDEALTALVQEGGPRQRAAAVEVLGITGWRGSLETILKAVTDHPVEADPVWRSIAATAVSQHATGHELASWLTHTNRGVRLTALLALRRSGDEAVRMLLDDADPSLILEAARAINDAPINSALPALAGLADPLRLPSLLKQFAAMPPPAEPVAAPGTIRDIRADQPLPWTNAPLDQLTPMLLRVVNANFRLGAPECATRLAAFATQDGLSSAVRAEAVNALANWGAPPARDRIVGIYRPLPARDDSPARAALDSVLDKLLAPELVRSGGPVALSAVEAAARLKLTNAEPALFVLVKDSPAQASVRAAALRALAALNSAKTGEALKLAAGDPAETLRLAASKLNAELNPDDAAGQLAVKLTTGTVAEQQSAFTSFGDLKSDAADAVLAEWLDKLMKREVGNEVMLDLVEAAGKRKAEAVKTRLAAYQDWKLPKDHLSPYRETLAGGDAARGRKIFYENAAVACTRCHQIGTDGGGNAGPPLAGVASRQPREYLLESIVFPNQQIAAGYQTAIITSTDGQSHAGVVKSETDSEVVLLSPEDGEVHLKKADIKSREKGLSGMPDGMGTLLTRQELRDLLEFVGSLK